MVPAAATGSKHPRTHAPPGIRAKVSRVTLEVRGIVQSFEGRRVLDGVDLDVPPGTIVGLLGPNGAGKTTLMRIVFGVLDPEAGTVEWRGRPVTIDDRHRWGYMPQERGLYREMRVHDHLVWLARLYGLDRRDAAERADDLLGRLGLADRSRDAIRDLSGGMSQRVQLAAAMVHRPELLVLDEPFAGLDPTAVEFLSNVIRDHVADGGHLVFSSHQLDLVEHLCESIVLIDRGTVVVRGRLRELRAASHDRYLRVDVDVDAGWVAPHGVEHIERSASGSRLLLPSGADAGALLDVVRAHVVVSDFGVEAPTLSELFLAATRATPGPTDDQAAMP
jgi:ABC-2 type transport system ATP-binding protein